jgi:hypothetical protein
MNDLRCGPFFVLYRLLLRFPGDRKKTMSYPARLKK